MSIECKRFVFDIFFLAIRSGIGVRDNVSIDKGNDLRQLRQISAMSPLFTSNAKILSLPNILDLGS